MGLILFTDRVEKFIPPKKGRGHVMRVVTEILNAKPKGKGTNIAVALDLLGHLSKRRSVVFVMSDFMDTGYDRALRLSARKHDVVPIQVVDPGEEHLPNVGLALVEDLESGEIVEVDTSGCKRRCVRSLV
ncbi:MAG: VWA domain-containing protein [Polyangiales bacterium]